MPGYLSTRRVPWRAFALLSTLLLAAVDQFALQSLGQEGRVEGVVVSGTTGIPRAGVRVLAIQVPSAAAHFPTRTSDLGDPAGFTIGPVMTAEDGRFSFRYLPTGWYQFMVFDAGEGFLYGALEPQDSGRMVRLGPGEAPFTLRIPLWQLGSIVGHARTESGDSIPGLAIVARDADDRSAAASEGSTMTDDRGRFILTLRPGRYVVSTSRAFWGMDPVLVPGERGELKSFPSMFYPSSSGPEGAVPVTVTSGQRTDGIDFRLTAQPWLTVTGRLEQADSDTKVRAIDVSGSSPLIEGAVSGHSFSIQGLMPGHYRLQLITRPAGWQLSTPPTLWADEPLAVADRDVQISPMLTEGFRISGTLEFEGVRPASSDLKRFSLRLESNDNDVDDWWGHANSNGTFSTIQLAPGRYYMEPVFPRWFLKSVTSGSGRDLTGAPLTVERDIPDVTIRFSDQPARIQGTVRPPPGRDVPRVWVALFPFERELWTTTEDRPVRFARILLGTDGRYEALLPPGRYYAIAVDRRVIWADDWGALAARAEVVDLRQGLLTRDLAVVSTR